MRLMISLTTVILLAASCARSVSPPAIEEAKLRIKFYNKTTYTLDSLLIGETLVGSIAADSSSGYVLFNHFRLDTGNANESIQAYMQGKKVLTIPRSRCASQRSVQKEGELAFALVADTFRDTTELRLEQIK